MEISSAILKPAYLIESLLTVMINQNPKNKLVSDYDVVIIGAGLGGLSSGLRLQSYGAHVAIVERLERVGGLCGTYDNDGHEMVIACNDFGLGMEKILHRLGVNIKFAKPKTKIMYDRQSLMLPPNFKTLSTLLAHPIDLYRYYRALKRSWKQQDLDMNIENLVNNNVSNPKLRDLLKLPAYLMGVSPSTLQVETLHHELDFEYGYWQPTTPIGGPQLMVDTMAEVFSKHGDIFLSTEFKEVHQHKTSKAVITDKGTLTTRQIINATPQYSTYPATLKKGLAISTYALVVSKQFQYPENIHTIVHYPPDITDWFCSLERGTMPTKFGFHIYCSDLSNHSAATNTHTMNIFFYLPRKMDTVTKLTQQLIEKYIFTELEQMLPGISQHIKQKYFVSPSEFLKKHGLSSRVTPIITPAGFSKPANYDAESDLFFVGSSVYPPGDHAGAAVLSGITVADTVGKKIMPQKSLNQTAI